MVLAVAIPVFANSYFIYGEVSRENKEFYDAFACIIESLNNNTVEVFKGIILVSDNNEGWYLFVCDNDLTGQIKVAYMIGNSYFSVVFDITGIGFYYIGDGSGKDAVSHCKVGEFIRFYDEADMGTLTVRVFVSTYEYYELNGDPEPAPAGIIINVNDIEYGLTGDDGTLTFNVPAGDLEVDARRYPGEWSWDCVVLAPGEYKQVDIVLDEGKEIAENSRLVIDQLHGGVLAHDFDVLTLRFLSRGGDEVVLDEVSWVELLDPRSGNGSFVEHLFMLRPDGTLILNDIGAFKKLLPERSSRTALRVSGGDIGGRSHDQVLEFYVSSYAENSTLVIDQLQGGVLDRDFDVLTLRFLSRGGDEVVLDKVSWVELLDPRSGNSTSVEHLFTLRPDGTLVLDAIVAFRKLLSERSSKIELRVRCGDIGGRTHDQTLEFYVGSYRVAGRLMAPPSNPGLNTAGITIIANYMDTDLVFNAVSDADGYFELPLMPVGNLDFTSKTVQNGKYYYGQGILALNGDKFLTVNMMDVIDLMNDVPPFTVAPSSLSSASNGASVGMQPDPERMRLHQLLVTADLDE